DSVFLGCIYVISEYRGVGVAKRLLVEIEKDLIKDKVKSIESIGKRLNVKIPEPGKKIVISRQNNSDTLPPDKGSFDSPSVFFKGNNFFSFITLLLN
ncbi:unnamed protein product, partial [marine sediment metagenome]